MLHLVTSKQTYHGANFALKNMDFENARQNVISCWFKVIFPRTTALEICRGFWQYRTQNSLSTDVKYYTFNVDSDEQRLTIIDRRQEKNRKSQLDNKVDIHLLNFTPTKQSFLKNQDSSFVE